MKMPCARPWTARACTMPRFRAMDRRGATRSWVTPVGAETNEQALDQGKLRIIQALESNAPAGKVDLNNASSLTIKNYLMDKDPLHLGSDASPKYTALGQAIADYRDKSVGGVLSSIDQLNGATDPPV